MKSSKREMRGLKYPPPVKEVTPENPHPGTSSTKIHKHGINPLWDSV